MVTNGQPIQFIGEYDDRYNDGDAYSDATTNGVFTEDLSREEAANPGPDNDANNNDGETVYEAVQKGLRALETVEEVQDVLERPGTVDKVQGVF
ncbi:MAG: hypothetical protein ACMUIL_10995 [bacterium]